jgi:hypothetical protein
MKISRSNIPSVALRNTEKELATSVSLPEIDFQQTLSEECNFPDSSDASHAAHPPEISGFAPNPELERYTFEANQANLMKHQLKQNARQSFTDLGKNWWKLTIDMKQQDKGPDAFETEPGYLNAMENGFNLMVETIGQPITPELICHFHDTCVDGVRHDPGNYRGCIIKEACIAQHRAEIDTEQANNGMPPLPAYFDEFFTSSRGKSYFFDEKTGEECWIITNPDYELKDEYKGNRVLGGLIKDIVSFEKGFRSIKKDASYEITIGENGYGTQEGMDEIVSKCMKANGDPYSYESFGTLTATVDKASPAYRWRSGPMSEDEIKSNISMAAKEYEKNISAAGNADEKLYAIVDFCQYIERLHPFSDANGRTIAQLLLNKCLIENEFPSFVILNDPNNLDGFSRAQFVDEIKKGFENYTNSLPSKESTGNCVIL